MAVNQKLKGAIASQKFARAQLIRIDKDITKLQSKRSVLVKLVEKADAKVFDLQDI